MAEKLQPSESRFGKEWIMYGQDFGAKTDDLLAFEAMNLPDLRVIPGIAVGASYFREFLEENGFDAQTPENKLRLEKTKIPSSLKSVQREILAMIPIGTPFMIRSSAIGEHGGTGIYDSEIMIRTENNKDDLKTFTDINKLIYAGYNSESAHAYRERLGQLYDGMGLLVHPLYGDQYRDIHYPVLSGVMTVVNGSPLLRLVNGLGISSVEMDKAVVLKRDQINLDNLFESARSIKAGTSWNNGIVTPWKNQNGMYDNIEDTSELFDQIDQAIPKLKPLISRWTEFFEQNRQFYWEFAVTVRDPNPMIHQSTELIQKEHLEQIPEVTGKIICDGEDVVGEGIREGRGIVWIGRNYYEPSALAWLHDWNRKNKNYLLILPDKVFSRAGGTRVQFKDFSNAAGVIELQYIREQLSGMYMLGTVNHTHKRGGAHFTELCGQTDILFLGSEQPPYQNELEERLGEPTQSFYHYAFVWDTPFKLINSADYGWVELLGETKYSDYQISEIKDWADEFWRLGHDFDDDRERSNACYKFTHFLADQMIREIGFNPLDITDMDDNERQELQETLTHIRNILQYTNVYYNYSQEKRYVDEAEFRLEKFIDALEIELRKSS